MAYFIIRHRDEYDYKYKEIVVDEEEDLALIDINDCCPGSSVYVIASSNLYMLTTKKEWRLQ